MSSPTDYSTRRVYQAKPITLARSLGFGVLDLMGGGWNTIISGLMLYFFTTYGNVTALEAGTILFVARIVDALISLLIGPLTTTSTAPSWARSTDAGTSSCWSAPRCCW